MEFCTDIYFYEALCLKKKNKNKNKNRNLDRAPLNMTQIRFQIFKTFTNKAERLLQELLSHFNKYGINSVNKFFKDFDTTTKFQLKSTTEDAVLEILKTLRFPRYQALVIFPEDSQRILPFF